VTVQADSTALQDRLLQISTGVVLQQALFAAASLGLADLLAGNPRSISELVQELRVCEPALLRLMRLLACQGVFAETIPGVFTNTAASDLLRSGVPGSVRAIVVLRGSPFLFNPFAETLYSIETGLPAREKLYGKNAFEHLKEDPALARIFDDGMTNLSELVAPAIAAAYDFEAWSSLMDVGGGNGILLAAILRRHSGLVGSLADLPHVLERARERGFLGGDLEHRSEFRSCDFFQEVPSGCRAYLMKSIIHDWDDQRAREILVNCRRAVPDDGVLLLVEVVLLEDNTMCEARVLDISMMVLTGGRERTVQQYRDLLSDAGFQLSRVIPVSDGFCIMEAVPIQSIR
jgi:O-methyltransferase domain